MEFYSQYNPKPHKGHDPKGKTMVQTHFMDECDINQIIAKARRGIVPQVFFTQKSPWFGDFSNGLSYHDMQNVLIDTEKAFMELPAKVRERFKNDPAALVAFLDNEDNRDEAIKLGLIPEPPKAQDQILKEAITDGFKAAQAAKVSTTTPT